MVPCIVTMFTSNYLVWGWNSGRGGANPQNPAFWGRGSFHNLGRLNCPRHIDISPDTNKNGIQMGITLYSNSMNELTVTSQFSIFNLISILNSDYFGQSPVRLCYPYLWYPTDVWRHIFPSKKIALFSANYPSGNSFGGLLLDMQKPHDTCCQKFTVPILSLFLFSHPHMLLSHVDTCKSNHGHIPQPPSATAPAIAKMTADLIHKWRRNCDYDCEKVVDEELIRFI